MPADFPAPALEIGSTVAPYGLTAAGIGGKRWSILRSPDGTDEQMLEVLVERRRFFSK